MKNLVETHKSGLAVTSLILGIVSFIPLFGLVLGILAIILGIVGLREVRTNKLGGKKLAYAGIALGLFGILFTFIVYGSIGMIYEMLIRTSFIPRYK